MILEVAILKIGPEAVARYEPVFPQAVSIFSSIPAWFLPGIARCWGLRWPSYRWLNTASR